MKDIIDKFYEKSCRLNGHEIIEREQWNTFATAQEIKKFSYGICDENPLWLDAEYARSGPFGKQVAPPSFLISVLYPMLHGAPMDVPMTNMASHLQFEWHLPVFAGNELQATARQTSVRQGRDRNERRIIFIDSETRYRNQKSQSVGTATATVAWIENHNRSLLPDRQIHAYSEEEIIRIKNALKNYKRRGNKPFDPLKINIGDTLPELVTAPLTLGDISYWEAVTGPNYRPGGFTARHSNKDRTTTFKNPLTGWDVQKGQSHLDFHLATHRGVPAPFDYGVMRFAFLSTLLTDWIGDFGKLELLKVNFSGLVIYGDATFYTGRIVNKKILKNYVELTIKISGRNQLNHPIASAESIVQIPISGALKKKTISLSAKYQSDNKPLNTGFIHLFEQNVKRNPLAIAVKDSQSEISYLELNKQSNRLANMLTDLGAKANTVIGILLNRNIEWIVAMISIWKCGAAYLPLDRNASGEWIKYILDDAAASLLISTSEMDRVQFNSESKIIFLDREKNNIQQQSPDYQKQSIQSEDLAYLMYTSGSSGNSKPVFISNRALSEYMKVLPECLKPEPDDHCLSTAAFTFSASIRQLCYPLAHGLRLIIANEKERKDPLSLASLIDQEKITTWDTVPSVWLRSCERIFLNKTNSDRPVLNSLKTIVLTGEPLTWKQVNHWYQNIKHHTRIINLYSQTETAGSVAAFIIHPGQAQKKGNVPLGSPLPATRFFLLDENLTEVKKGTAGEICVSNNRLATGYVGYEKLTSKHFIDYLGAPLYRTGDLARLNRQNFYEFIGRKDRRIKLRGFRIDLDEIESVLNSYPNIRESAVLILKKTQNEKLAAFVSPENKTDFSTDQLRTYLKQKLPDFMIPHLIETIDTFPRTQSGKIDRNSLLTMDFSSASNRPSALTKAQTDLEKILAKIWKKVIGVQSVNIRDNFFDLGGDSLTAIQLLNEIEKETEHKLPVDTFINLSTIESMASFIDQNHNKRSPANFTEKLNNKNLKGFFDQQYPDHYKKMLSIVVGRNKKRPRPGSLIVNIVPDNGNPPILFCANGLYEAEALTRELGADVPFYFVESGYAVGNRDHDYIQSLAHFHIRDILTIKGIHPLFIMGYSFGCSVAFEIARQLTQQGKRIAFLGLVDPRIGPAKHHHRYKKIIEKIDFARFMFNDPDKLRLKIKKFSDPSLLMMLFKSFRMHITSGNEKRTIMYKPMPYKNEFYIFQAKDAILRNMLFPNSGWSKKDFPKIKIISVPGNHTSILDQKNSIFLSNKLKGIISSKRMAQ